MAIIKSLTGYDKNESAAWKKGYWEGMRLILWAFLPIFVSIALAILVMRSM